VTRRPFVSVLTPVYNGGDYLVECIESVLAQTHKNWDYTIVDNASTDATCEIAERFAKRDSRICHLRFDDFVSSTANHNRAFSAINPESEFCKVVQADDWLYPECLSLMIGAAGAADTIGVVSAYQLWERRVHLYGLPYNVSFARGRDVLRSTLLGEFNVTGGPTATLLRSAFVRERQPFYEEGLLHEDSEAMLWMHSRYDLAFVHQVLTFARQQPQARTRWTANINSAGPEAIIFLLRYGKLVLNDDEYRARLRALLRNYVWWHIRQFPRPSRLRDSDFFEFHRSRRRLILADANGDPEVGLAMSMVGALLARRVSTEPSSLE
jgi:glycosyltransferase involved in cell wall biosynthesis